jgi:hypothetical protein
MYFLKIFEKRKIARSWCQWLMPVILATQEAAIRRITVQSHSREIICKTVSQKKPRWHTTRAGGVAQGLSPEMKCQYSLKKKKNRLMFIGFC